LYNIPEDQGCAGGSVGAEVLGVAGGAGTPAPASLAGLGAAGGAGMLRLCFCASGITSGPF